MVNHLLSGYSALFPALDLMLLRCLLVFRVPFRVSHVAIGESSKELAKPNLWILAKSINISFS